MSDGEKDTPTRSARQWVVVRGTSMDLRVGAGILSEFPGILRSAAGRPHACALVHEAAAPDEAVRVLHDNLCDQGFRVSVLPLGEVGCNLSEVERLSAMLRDARITADDIVFSVKNKPASFNCSKPIKVFNFDLNTAVKNTEKTIIREAMKEFNSSRKLGAALGISHTSIIRKMKEYNLHFKE